MTFPVRYTHRHNINGKASPTYNTWRGMKQRCNHPSQKCYKNYGGRGIQYCRRWESFVNFLADMGVKPDGMTLDRIDVNGPYEKDNCRWVSNAFQQSNRRNNFNLTYKGRTMTMSEWARELNIAVSTLQQRLRRQRWTIEQTLSTPVDKAKSNKRKKVVSEAEVVERIKNVLRMFPDQMVA